MNYRVSANGRCLRESELVRDSGPHFASPRFLPRQTSARAVAARADGDDATSHYSHSCVPCNNYATTRVVVTRMAFLVVTYAITMWQSANDTALVQQLSRRVRAARACLLSRTRRLIGGIINRAHAARVSDEMSK